MKENNEELEDSIKEGLNAIETVDLGMDELPEQVGKELTDEEIAKIMPKNIPYAKILNSEGELANPITKEDPYRSPFLNRRDKKALIKKATKHPKNNKKGIRLVVTKFAKGKFVKTEIIKQRVEKGYSNPQLNDDGSITNENKVYKAKTLIHNQIQL